MKKRFLLISIACLLLTSGMHAQVTIGSGQKPAAGALLDLKEKPDGTADKGLGMPRVSLTNPTPTTDAQLAASIGATGAWDRAAHIGLIVYNTNKQETTNRICPGLHVWTGDKWQTLKPYAVIDPAKTIISKNITAETSRTDITGTPGYTVGPLGQITDVRGPAASKETNQYHHARFYAYRVQAIGDITYRGVKNTNVCDPSSAVIEDWTEIAVPVEYVDDGVWMTENMNTEYLTAASQTKMLKSSANSNLTPQYFSPLNTGASPAQIIQNGFFYNWAAATNQKGGTVDGRENVDNPGVFKEEHSVQKERQGICPDGWHLPSDKEYNELEAIYAPSSSNFTLSPSTAFTWLDTYNTTLEAWRPSGGGGPGTSMISATSLSGSSTFGNSKTAADGGFNLLLTGTVIASAPADLYGKGSFLWSASSYSQGGALYRWFSEPILSVWRSYKLRYTMYSVRCKKN